MSGFYATKLILITENILYAGERERIFCSRIGTHTCADGVGTAQDIVRT